jgi:hypothetical protein
MFNTVKIKSSNPPKIVVQCEKGSFSVPLKLWKQHKVGQEKLYKDYWNLKEED